ncbi:MAG: aminotransferase class I/II-fold pyridoxal phosphate-dependent enzyme [bacterium]|nr:aminotransferase class I/II-fold pyridoxal phosphate-dependent enzyme [bacterium]
MVSSSVESNLNETLLYEQTAKRIHRLIKEGVYPPGSRLPSVRRLSEKWNVSISTVMEAYRQLDDRGVVEVRPKSGHFVRLAARKPAPAPARMPGEPKPVQVSDLILDIFHHTRNEGLFQLGAGIPCPDLLPIEKLHRTLGALARRKPVEAMRYNVPPGNFHLRVEIARRMIDAGCTINPDDIVTTFGCMDAVSLCMRAICKPGDIVAVESPTYYEFLQMLELLGCKALEIPTAYPGGLCQEALRFALDHHKIAALVVIPNFSNPTGTLMTDANKQALVDMMADYEIPIIEDDLYTDLHYGDERPRALKSFDRKGLVYYCSSFSKSLAPGYRVGWTAAGSLSPAIERLQAAGYIATAGLPEMAIAEFLSSGGFNAHVRRIRKEYQARTEALADAVRRYFPGEVKINPPLGGFYVWVEAPKRIDAVELLRRALDRGITITPGAVFSNSGRFQHFIRLNAAFFTEDKEHFIQTLGRLAAEMSR